MKYPYYWKEFEPLLTERIERHLKVLLFELHLASISLKDIEYFFYGYVAGLHEYEIITNECYLKSQVHIRDTINSDID